MLQHNVVHADEAPVQMLSPGAKKTHRVYVWAYATTPFAELSAVVYDFTPSRAGEHRQHRSPGMITGRLRMSVIEYGRKKQSPSSMRYAPG
ncbi:Transposase IS66 family protein [compost metagenome]